MLQRLLIENYILIERTEIFPGRSLNVVTGETGAGKSIVLGALGLLKGGQMPRVPLDKKCVVEAEFSPLRASIQESLKGYDVDVSPVLLLRKEVTPAGRSRTFLNDTPVSKKVFEEVGDCLVEIHAQHQNTRLSSEKFQRELLDVYGGLTPLLGRYQRAYEAYVAKKRAYEAYMQNEEKEEELRELHLFQHRELSTFGLVSGEEKALEEEHTLLSHAQSIQAHLKAALDALEGGEGAVLLQLYHARKGLASAQEQMPELAGYVERLDSTQIELQDIAEDLRKKEKSVQDNPSRLEEVGHRLHGLYALQKKYKLPSSAALLSLQEKLERRVGAAGDVKGHLEAMERALAEAERVMAAAGGLLSSGRKKAAQALEAATRGHLQKLGLGKAVFNIEVLPAAAASQGMDQVRFMFSANPGMPAREIGKVASGGELSRLMLVIKYLVGGKVEVATMVFDEIDTGISGEPSYQMIRMIEEIASHHQVLTITHLPQFAARGDMHFHVYKEERKGRNRTFVKRLYPAARVQEIAKMVDGDPPRAEVIRSVHEMIKHPHA